MVQTVVAAPRGGPGPGTGRHGVALAAGAAALVGLVLGYLGWVLPTPGGSLVVPALVVFGIGATLTVGSGILVCARPRRREVWTFAAMVGVLTVVASVWTFEFSLPAWMAWDSGATQQARAALAQLQRAPSDAHGVPRPSSCVDVATGSIGPLRAPYLECAVSTSEGHFVTFRSAALGGLGYTDIGAATFSDECSRHLAGKWWMYVADASGIGNCPIGYRFHGGG